MRKFFLSMFMLLAVTFSNAQTGSQQKTEPVYYCTKSGCPLTSHTEANCPHHHTAMVLQGKFYCPMHPEITGDSALHCSKCHMDMMKMEKKKKGNK